MRARLSALLALLVVAAGSCGRATTLSSTAPSAPKCQVSVESSVATAPAAGVNGTLTVTTTRDCTWDASSGVNWISLTSAANGQGSGTVAYRVDPNGVPASRKGTLEVNGFEVAVAQEAAPCRFTVTPPISSVSASGGAVSLSVETLTGCAWTAASQTPWIRVTNGASANASGAVALSIGENAGAARSGIVVVAGQNATINQAEAAPTPTPTPTPTPCSYAISPATDAAPAAGHTGSIAVTAGSACTWTAISNASWITFTSIPSATGSGSIGFSIAANGGAARTGTATIAGQTFTVTQAAAGCSFALSPASQSIDSPGGSGSFTVASGSWCTWTASAGAPWITVTSGASGSGNGSVGFSAAANTGAARSGTISVGGQAFTVTQAAAPPPPPPPCTYSISPAAQSVDASGGSGTVAVTASTPSCTWTAVSNNGDWLAVTAGASGTGNGSVNFSTAANSGAARTGTITIAGQTFTVSQAAAPPPPPPPPPPACTFSISPTSQAMPVGGGTGSVGITASDPSCAWTAMSNTGWLAITSPASGSGSSTLMFSAAPNGDGAPRSGTLTIAGQTFTVTEASSHDDGM